MKKVLYDSIKKNINKDETEIFLIKNKYDENTGEKTEEIETLIDIDLISNRINALQAEIDNLTTIKNRIQANDFDIIVDDNINVKGKN